MGEPSQGRGMRPSPRCSTGVRTTRTAAATFSWALALLCTAAGCTGPAGESSATASAAGSAATASAAEELTLSFAWPGDLTAVVDVKRVRFRDDGRSDLERVVEARYRIRTEPQLGGLRIVSEGLQITRVDGRLVMNAAVDDPEATAALLVPTLRVDAEGKVLEVEGLEGLRRQTAERIAAESPQAAAQAEWIARMALSPEKLTEHWTSAVESWVGMELEVGATYEMEVNEARPGTLEVSERMPCLPGGAAGRCLQLRLESWLDGEAGAAQVGPLARELAAQLGAPELPPDSLRLVEMREVVELVTEPERLVPHLVRTRRETRFEVAAGGERRSMTRIDETEHRYRY